MKRYENDEERSLAMAFAMLHRSDGRKAGERCLETLRKTLEYELTTIEALTTAALLAMSITTQVVQTRPVVDTLFDEEVPSMDRIVAISRRMLEAMLDHDPKDAEEHPFEKSVRSLILQSNMEKIRTCAKAVLTEVLSIKGEWEFETDIAALVKTVKYILATFPGTSEQRRAVVNAVVKESSKMVKFMLEESMNVERGASGVN